MDKLSKKVIHWSFASVLLTGILIKADWGIILIGGVMWLGLWLTMRQLDDKKKTNG